MDTNVPEGLGEAWIGMDPQQRYVSERKAWDGQGSDWIAVLDRHRMGLAVTEGMVADGPGQEGNGSRGYARRVKDRTGAARSCVEGNGAAALSGSGTYRMVRARNGRAAVDPQGKARNIEARIGKAAGERRCWSGTVAARLGLERQQGRG